MDQVTPSPVERPPLNETPEKVGSWVGGHGFPFQKSLLEHIFGMLFQKAFKFQCITSS